VKIAHAPPQESGVGALAELQGYADLEVGITFGPSRQVDDCIAVFEPKQVPDPSKRPLAIDSHGEITGDYLERQPVTVPNLRSTQPAAINDKGKIAGAYVDANGFYHGFARDK